MHVHFLDPYRPGHSLLHALDPRLKLVLALAFILTTALAPTGAWPVYILLLALVISAAVLSELGVGTVLRRAVLAAPFVLAALPVLFTISGPILLQIPLGAWSLTITQPGMERFISIAMKSWISVQAAILLSAVTPFPDLLAGLRALGIPSLLVSIFGLMWRYLFVMVDEVLRMARARQARSGAASQPGLRTGGSVTWRARVTGGMAGTLFIRAFERSDRIYNAMLARGYDGEVRSAPMRPLTSGERLTLIAAVILFALLLVFANI